MEDQAYWLCSLSILISIRFFFCPASIVPYVFNLSFAFILIIILLNLHYSVGWHLWSCRSSSLSCALLLSLNFIILVQIVLLLVLNVGIITFWLALLFFWFLYWNMWNWWYHLKKSLDIRTLYSFCFFKKKLLNSNQDLFFELFVYFPKNILVNIKINVLFAIQYFIDSMQYKNH